MEMTPGDPRAVKVAVFVVAAVLVCSILGAFGCGPIAVDPRPPPTHRPIAFLMCAPHANLRLDGPGFDVDLTAAADGNLTIAEFPTAATKANLHIRAAGAEPYDYVIDIPADPPGHIFHIGHCGVTPQSVAGVEVFLPAFRITRPFEAEHGVLIVRDRHFETEDGQPWSWRGASMFLLYARYATGQDISNQLAWMEARGINVARVFDLTDNPDWNLASYGVADPGPVDSVKLGAFFDLLAAHGLRVEYVPLTKATDLASMRARVQQAYDVAAGRWNVLIEICNECENNGVDPRLVLEGVDRHGVLSASGMDPGRHCAAVDSDNALWNACMRREVLVIPGGYLTAHDLARDENHSPRNTKDFTIDYAGVFRVAIVADEHIGIIDRNYLNYAYEANGFAHHVPDGGGVRTIDCNVILSAAGIEHIYGPGFTIHLQAGLEGRAPRADEPIQTGCAERLTKLWQFIPPIAQLGSYLPAHGSGFPFAWLEADSLVQHGYCSPVTNTAWCVMPMPRPGWPGFVGTNGWTLDAIGPEPYLGRFTR